MVVLRTDWMFRVSDVKSDRSNTVSSKLSSKSDRRTTVSSKGGSVSSQRPDTTCAMQGILSRENKFLGFSIGWKELYFELSHEGTLSYWNTEEDARAEKMARCTVKIDGSVTICSTREPKPGRSAFRIDRLPAGPQLTVASPNPAKASDWVRALKKARDQTEALAQRPQI